MKKVVLFIFIGTFFANNAYSQWIGGTLDGVRFSASIGMFSACGVGDYTGTFGVVGSTGFTIDDVLPGDILEDVNHSRYRIDSTEIVVAGTIATLHVSCLEPICAAPQGPRGKVTRNTSRLGLELFTETGSNFITPDHQAKSLSHNFLVLDSLITSLLDMVRWDTVHIEVDTLLALYVDSLFQNEPYGGYGFIPATFDSTSIGVYVPAHTSANLSGRYEELKDFYIIPSGSANRIAVTDGGVFHFPTTLRPGYRYYLQDDKTIDTIPDTQVNDYIVTVHNAKTIQLHEQRPVATGASQESGGSGGASLTVRALSGITDTNAAIDTVDLIWGGILTEDVITHTNLQDVKIGYPSLNIFYGFMEQNPISNEPSPVWYGTSFDGNSNIVMAFNQISQSGIRYQMQGRNPVGDFFSEFEFEPGNIDYTVIDTFSNVVSRFKVSPSTTFFGLESLSGSEQVQFIAGENFGDYYLRLRTDSVNASVDVSGRIIQGLTSLGNIEFSPYTLPLITAMDTSVWVSYPDGSSDWVDLNALSGGGTINDFNFAEDNLTFSGNRLHDLNGFGLEISTGEKVFAFRNDVLGGSSNRPGFLIGDWRNAAEFDGLIMYDDGGGGNNKSFFGTIKGGNRSGILITNDEGLANDETVLVGDESGARFEFDFFDNIYAPTLAAPAGDTSFIVTWEGGDTLKEVSLSWLRTQFESGGVGDNWGSQIVQTDGTLTGTGTVGSPLGLSFTLTQSNGLSDGDASSSYDFELGGALERNTTINAATYDFAVTNSDVINLDAIDTLILGSASGTGPFKTLIKSGSKEEHLIGSAGAPIDPDYSVTLLSSTILGNWNFEIDLNLSDGFKVKAYDNEMQLRGSTLNIKNVPTYADEASAIANGLVSGDLYKVQDTAPSSNTIYTLCIVN